MRIRHAGEMAAGDVAKRHDRAKRDAIARISTADDAGAIVTDRVEAVDGF